MDASNVLRNFIIKVSKRELLRLRAESAFPVNSDVSNLLKVAANRRLLNLVHGVGTQDGKFQQILEKFIPKVSSELLPATQYVLKAQEYSEFVRFLSEDPVTKVLQESVAVRLFEDLRNASTQLRELEPLLQRWEVECPDTVNLVQPNLQLYRHKLYQTGKLKSPDEAVEAMVQLRKYAYCVVHAAITGAVVLDKYAGVSNLVLTSELFKSYKGLGTYRSLPLGSISSLSWNTKKFNSQEGQTLGIALGVKSNVFETLFAKFVAEADEFSLVAKNQSKKVYGNDVFAQVHKALCPILSYDPGYLLKKGMDVREYYGLYKLGNVGTGAPLNGILFLGGGAVEPTFNQAWLEGRGYTRDKLLRFGFKPEQPLTIRNECKLILDKITEKVDTHVVERVRLAHIQQTVLEPQLDMEVLRSLVRIVKDIAPAEYANLVTKATKQAIPSLAMKNNEEVHAYVHRASSEERVLIGKYCALHSVDILEHLGIERTLDDRLLNSKNVAIYKYCVPEANKLVLPFNSTGIFHTKTTKEFCFEKQELTYSQASRESELYLTEDHYTKLSINRKGVLADRIIAMLGLHSTVNLNYASECHGHFVDPVVQRVRHSMHVELIRANVNGLLVLPFTKLQGDSGTPMQRLRTEDVENKYRSCATRAVKEVEPDNPITKNPLYVYPPIVSKLAYNFVKDSLVTELKSELGCEPEAITVVLAKLKFDNLFDALGNTCIPLLAMEGEKKIAAVNQMQEEGVKNIVRRVIKGELNIKDVVEYPFVCPVGTIGVWMTTSESGHDLIPELKGLKLKDRVVIIGHDGDGSKNVGVAQAAVMFGAALRENGAKPYYWYPPKGNGKGFDDWVEEHAKLVNSGNWASDVVAGYLEMESKFNGQLRRLDSVFTYQELTAALRSGQNLQEFISKPPKPPIRPQTNLPL